MEYDCIGSVQSSSGYLIALQGEYLIQPKELLTVSFLQKVYTINVRVFETDHPVIIPQLKKRRLIL